MTADVKHKPGSPAARSEGCTCPVADNHHGKGRGGDGLNYGWYVFETCPLHGTPLADDAAPDATEHARNHED